MDRVLKELAKLREAPDKDAVHDLRVAIRRCRSVGAVLKEVDPDPAWHQMRRLPRKLFRKLGELRDTQIMDEWVTEHGAENDKLRGALHEFFQQKEPALIEETLRLAGKFDTKLWKHLERKLRERVRLVPSGSLAAQCLAVERLQEGRDLHGKALRAAKPTSWHALRIGVKKFRYTVESLLPSQYESWSPSLKRMQDLLGEVHDLDVLTGIIRQQAPPDTAELQAEWYRTIERERGLRLAEYRELAVGYQGVWQQWRHGLPSQEHLEAAAMARLRATARAAGVHATRTARVSRLALALFDVLGRAHVAPAFQGRAARRVLRGAACLCGLRLKGSGKSQQKAARRVLLDLPVPPSWTPQEWALLAWTVRYHRGAEPKPRTGAFAKLSPELQSSVRALAGVLRLARGLHKCGVSSGTGFRAEKTPAAVILQIPGLPDSAEAAALLAGAKHLLDSYLEQPLMLKLAVKPEEVAVAAPEPEENVLRIASSASD
jgi:CHAD domain-containing protein